MGSSIKVSASTAERLIMYTGHLSAFTRRGSNTKPRRGDAPRRAHLHPEAPFKAALPTLPPHAGNTPSLPKTGKKGTVLRAWVRTSRLGRALCLSVPDTSCRNQGRKRTV